MARRHCRFGNPGTLAEMRKVNSNAEEQQLSEERLDREASFHDQRFEDDQARASVGKFYAVTATSKSFYHELIRLAAKPGSRVLEYGCGSGGLSLELSSPDREVHAIDLSRTGLRAARRQLHSQHRGLRVSHVAMNAERLGYGDGHFDVVFGSGILHHLDLRGGIGEVARVLKPSGQGIFFEPLGHNVLINLYRRLTPQMRTADEHPLVSADLGVIAEVFEEVEVGYFHFLSLAAVVVRGTGLFSPLLRVLAWVDRALFLVPWIRRQAWIVVICARRPKGKVRA